MYVFGPGKLVASLPGGTPVDIGLAQEITFSTKRELKELYGQDEYPVAIGAGTSKTTVKVKLARFSGLALSQLLTGAPPTAGGTFMQPGQAFTLPGSSPTVTLSPANSGTFLADQGVLYSATGLPLTYTTGAPTTGTYSVNTSTGVYAFAAGDASAGVIIGYTYKTGSLGQSFIRTNTLIGPTITVGCNILITDPTNSLSGLVQVFQVVFDGIDFASKLEDFEMPEMNGKAYANAAGQVWNYNTPDKF